MNQETKFIPFLLTVKNLNQLAYPNIWVCKVYKAFITNIEKYVDRYTTVAEDFKLHCQYWIYPQDRI